MPQVTWDSVDLILYIFRNYFCLKLLERRRNCIDRIDLCVNFISSCNDSNERIYRIMQEMSVRWNVLVATAVGLVGCNITITSQLLLRVHRGDPKFL